MLIVVPRPTGLRTSRRAPRAASRSDVPRKPLPVAGCALLAAGYRCTLRLDLRGPQPREAAWTSHEHSSTRHGRARARSCCSPLQWHWVTWSASTTPACRDSAILERLNDDARQVAAGIAMPVLAAGVALLLWFATGLRWVLDRLSGGDPLAHAAVPAAALFGGLMITGVSFDVASAYAALSDEFTADADTARALGTAGSVVALTGLIGGGVLVAVTTRIAQQARALPAWAVWASYVVAGLCLTGFWSGGMASVASRRCRRNAAGGAKRLTRQAQRRTSRDITTRGPRAGDPCAPASPRNQQGPVTTLA